MSSRKGRKKSDQESVVKRRWRDYKSKSGKRPVKEFLDDLPDDDAAGVHAAMAEVREDGLEAARKLDDDIYEVRSDGKDVIYRVLFSPEGSKSNILLALDGFKKKTKKTPPAKIRLAKRRLADWRRRGDEEKAQRKDG